MSISIHTDKHLFPTASGVYHAACQPDRTPAALWFTEMLRSLHTTSMSLTAIKNIMSIHSKVEFARLLEEIVSMGWLEEHDHTLYAPVGGISEVAPNLLTTLSSTGKGLLVDDQGLCLVSVGFDANYIDEIAAMSVRCSSLVHEYHDTLKDHTISSTGACGLVDAAGHNQIGVWPIFLNDRRFGLVLQGVPKLNNPNFTQLIWALYSRYWEA